MDLLVAIKHNEPSTNLDGYSTRKVFDIIIVNHNSTQYIVNCLNSIYDTIEGYAFNVIVQDNASTDNPALIKEIFPKVDLHLSNTNLGFAKAVNKSISLSTSPYIILLNPDAVIENGFFDSVLQYIEDKKDIGVLGPKIYEDNGNVQGSARAFPAPLTALFGRKSPIAKLFPNNSITAKNILTTRHDGKSAIDVDWVSGACMVVRRDAVERVGGMDERFFLYWEDADWCRRFREAGWKVVYYPGAEVTHIGGKSSATNPLFAIYHFHKSSYILFNKYVKGPMAILNPFAGVGLMFRCLLVMGSNVIRKKIIAKQQGFRYLQKGPAEKINNKIKVVSIVSRFNIGGASIIVKNLTEKLDKNRFETKLITGSAPKHEGDMSYIMANPNGTQIVVPELQREISLKQDIIAFIKILRIIKKIEPDIIHTHMAKAGTLARTAVFLHNLFAARSIRTVHTFHGHVLQGYFGKTKSRIFRLIERLVANVTDMIIAISDTQQWELTTQYKIAQARKIRKINLGFDLQPFIQAKKYKGMLRQQLGLSNDTLLVGTVGRLVPIKNHLMFLKAAKIFTDNNGHIKLKFIIVGDGELRKPLEKVVEAMKLNAHVFFHGWERDIPMIYADLDILGLTSINEGTPVSIIEAMAASVPVITTGVGGIKDLLGKIEKGEGDNVNFKICERGILCSNNDAESFAKGIHYMCNNGFLENPDLTDRAKAFVLRNYSDHRLVRDIENLYNELLND